jgi:hypothetical protein
MHVARRAKDHIERSLACRKVGQRIKVPDELDDTRLPALDLKGTFLFDERVRHGDLVPVEQFGEGAMALRAVTNNRGRFARASAKTKLFESRERTIRVWTSSCP